MVAELDLTDQDVTSIAEIIDTEIQAHIPEWTPFSSNPGSEIMASDYRESEAEDEITALPNDTEHPCGGLVLERLPSGRKYWSDSPRATSNMSTSGHTESNESCDLNSHASHDSFVGVFGKEDSSFNLDEQKIRCSKGMHSSNQQNDSSDDIDLNSHGSHVAFVGVYGKVGSSFNLDDKKIHCSEGMHLSNQQKGSSDGIDRNDNLESLESSEMFTMRHTSSNDSSSIVLTELFATGASPLGGELVPNGCENQDESLHMELLDDKSEDLYLIVKKLENLLIDQQKEFLELKKKHDMAVAETLKELHPALQSKALNGCRLKIPVYNIAYIEDEGHPANP